MDMNPIGRGMNLLAARNGALEGQNYSENRSKNENVGIVL
jgi:hypothetical protein